MAKLSYYLDTRKGSPKVKMVIAHGRRAVMLSMGVTLESTDQWTGQMSALIVGHPLAAAWNKMLTSRFASALDAMYEATAKEGCTIEDIKTAILDRIDPTEHHEQTPSDVLLTIWRKFMEGKSGRTFELYHETLCRIEKFLEQSKGGAILNLRIADITMQWLDDFDRWMSQTRGINSRAIDMRNLRAVCMYAWKYDYTSQYIFKRWSIEREEGDVHPLTNDQFSRLFSFDLSSRPDLALWRDVALLGFFLVGINIVDLHRAMWNEIDDAGYLNYVRAKTHRHYRLKIEPVAESIIERLKGEKKVLAVCERYKSHKDMTQHLNAALQKIGESHIETIEGSWHHRQRIVYEPILPELTYYQLRHTWAYMAANDCDIPKDVIALCLGHGKKTVTDVYVQYDQRKIDEANKKVIDFALSLINKPGA